MKILLVILIIIFGNTCYAQVKHPSSVMSSGGETMSTSTHILRGSVSQFVVNYLPHAQGAHGVGFWYQPSLLYRFQGNSSYIVIPSTAANSGDMLSVPMILESSNKLFKTGARTFEAKVRFNKSLLEPIDALQVDEVGDDYILTVRGEVKDSVGILAVMKFRARLGNDSLTPLKFESFRWIETKKLKVATQNGSFLLNDLCKAGGVNRLIKKGTSLSLATITPNPVGKSTVLSFSLSERTTIRISIIDVMGRELSIIKNEELASGTYETVLQTEFLANGKYFVVLRTTEDVLFQPMQIAK